MLSIHLAPLFKARGIDKPYSFLLKAGFTPHVASNLINNKVGVISLKHMEVLCRMLICEPNDLFLWTPDDKLPLANDHPLQKVGQQEAVKSFQDIISTIPFKQLKEMTKALADKSGL